MNWDYSPTPISSKFKTRLLRWIFGGRKGGKKYPALPFFHWGEEFLCFFLKPRMFEFGHYFPVFGLFGRAGEFP